MSSQITFPVGVDAQWQSPTDLAIPEPYLKNWLLDTGSLTERLQSLCRHFHLLLLGQQALPLLPEETQALSLSASEPGWQVREVILYGEHHPWVFARSVIPQALCQEEFGRLGEKPLGKVIFNDPRFTRKPFEITNLQVPEALTVALDIAPATRLWGRRSLFCYQQHEIMVAEIFLPRSPAYKMLDSSGEPS